MKTCSLPFEIEILIDSYYDKYRSFFNLVLYEIYNPYKTKYNDIVKELSGNKRCEISGKKIYSGKFRWLKLVEYSILGDKLVSKSILRHVCDKQMALISNIKCSKLETGDKYQLTISEIGEVYSRN